jgi:hypothetical protein
MVASKHKQKENVVSKESDPWFQYRKQFPFMSNSTLL